MTEWEPTGWWRVLRGDTLWCETSSRTEAEQAMESGDVLGQHFRRTEEEWRPHA